MSAPPYLDWDDQDAWRAAWEAWPCERCGVSDLYFIGPAKRPHYASLFCGSCGHEYKNHFLPWPPRSKAEEKAKRKRLERVKLDDDYCGICLRTRELLPEGVALEVRHIMDRAVLVDAGRPPDEPENLGWICTSPCKGIEIALRAAFDHER